MKPVPARVYRKRDLLLGFCAEAARRGLADGWVALKEASVASRLAARWIKSPLGRSIPECSLDSLLGSSRIEIKLLVSAYDQGMLRYSEALVLLALLVFHNPKVVLEIGTFHGYTAKAMAQNLPNGIIHTVDLPIDFDPTKDQSALPKDDFHLIGARVVGREFLNTPYASRIIQHFGDTSTWDFSVAQGADFFFIDGSHTYEHCKSDSEKCFALCGGRGTFLWHDCDEAHPGVLKFIAEWRHLGRDVVRVENSPLCYWSSL